MSRARDETEYVVKESMRGDKWRVYSVNAFAVEWPESGWFSDYDRAYERWLALRGLRGERR